MTAYRPARGRYMAHPRGDQMRRAREAGEYRLSVSVQVVLMGVTLAAFLFALPFVGLVLGAALGVDMTVLP